MLKFLENDKKCLYIIRPLCNNIFDSLDNNNELISIPDTYFKNISIKVPYLHIKKYKESRSREQNLYNLTIFSSIQSENIYTSPEETIHNKLCYQDKTWYILKKKSSIEDIEFYLKNKFYTDYIKKWLTRNDPSDKYDEKKLDIDISKYWLKCVVN